MSSKFSVGQVAAPGRGRLLPEDLERLEAEVAHPLRLVLHLRDLLDDLAGEPLAALERVVVVRVAEAVLVVVLDPRNLEVQIGRHGGCPSFGLDCRRDVVVVVLSGSRCRVSGRVGPTAWQGLPGSLLLRRFQLFLVLGGLGVFLADPVVALALEQLDQLGAAVLDDPAAEEDVDELGLDVGQDPLVVGDDQHAGAVPAPRPG